MTPANVQLPARQIGAQYFDGLDRLIGTTTGDRTEYFLFRDGESIPRQRINPAGETIELDYNLQLTNKPISNTAPEDHASFAYDPVSARLLSDDSVCAWPCVTACKPCTCIMTNKRWASSRKALVRNRPCCCTPVPATA
ncbi:hypothetical protein [Pseudomonas putida]|uniref:hypothetical protein n=1 Tax=Pseudomonas putida TaxID=303 RepID=UPI003905802F